jgi:hypothetical protein
VTAWLWIWACAATLAGGAAMLGHLRPNRSYRRQVPARPATETGCAATSATAWSTAWTCAVASRSLTADEAHRALRIHNEHNCARKRAAFESLVAAGCLTPDLSRPRRRQADRR